jgi:hypothetical protein
LPLMNGGHSSVRIDGAHFPRKRYRKSGSLAFTATSAADTTRAQAASGLSLLIGW